ncbi:MAG: DMT family transporter [Candidatus Eisenbacteria bacterium]|nr:DMT family transporter [Candidatus Eisenbacteria bacterium]
MASHAGELLSVLAALIWAFSVVLFRISGRGFSPLSLNVFKNSIATALLAITLAPSARATLPEAPLRDYALLALSGIVGITLADTIFFKSLNLVGAGLSQVIGCCYSPLVVLLSAAFLAERLSIGDLIGAALILSGVLLSAGHEPPPGVTRADIRRGTLLGALAFALMALGVVIAKPVLDRSPVLWSSTVRMAAGVGALLLVVAASPSRRYVWHAFRPSPAWKVAVPASVLGAYLAMIVWIAGIKYTLASTASILNQTSAVFVLPVAALVLKERITLRKLAAVALALGGVATVTLC